MPQVKRQFCVGVLFNVHVTLIDTNISVCIVLVTRISYRWGYCNDDCPKDKSLCVTTGPSGKEGKIPFLSFVIYKVANYYKAFLACFLSTTCT